MTHHNINNWYNNILMSDSDLSMSELIRYLPFITAQPPWSMAIFMANNNKANSEIFIYSS